MNKIIVNHLSREKRYAVLKGQVVDKLVIHQPKHQSAVGNIYLGIVEKVLPGMNAAFIQIGEEKSGYIHRDKLAAYVLDHEENTVKQSRSISSYVHQGERLLVQVEKDAAGTKGPRLTGVIEIQGSHLIYMPKGRYVAVSKKIENEQLREEWRQFGFQMKEQDEGIIFRTSCTEQTLGQLQQEFEQLRQDYLALLNKVESLKKPGKVLERNSFIEELQGDLKKLEKAEIIIDDANLKAILQKDPHFPIHLYTGKENIFSAYHIELEIEKALKKIVWLENGAYLIFDETEALTIIDVNTGKYSGKNNLRETVMKTNEWAAEEVARQIRLRDIGGMILIDFIDMKEEKDRQHIIIKLKAELMKDERRANVIGFTPLGILQLTRKKTKPAISEALTMKCSSCEGTGKVLSPETMAFRLERELLEYRNSEHEAVLIELSPDVEALFSGEESKYKKEMEERIRLDIIFITAPASKPFYEIRQFGKKVELMKRLYENES